ncbi:unnamed protein product [Notodromas monacha]|uniref:Proline-rich protein PRCC n=1 Tax=Notodromas monacha TaxID=399045 RepID=A0A7R9GA82_9CRUS|nr:unnamed protein product [Notodromas monacha]CAG0915055.1 unnamed protein product [Notodromas monacha]
MDPPKASTTETEVKTYPFDDGGSDEEDEKPTKAKLKPSNKGSGLFAVLPPPSQTVFENNKPKKPATSLVPQSVLRPRPPAPKPGKPKALPVQDSREDSDDEVECVEEEDFFGFNAKDPIPIIPILPTETLLVDSCERVREAEIELEEPDVIPDGVVHAEQNTGDVLPSGSNLLEDEDALLKLQGKRGMMKESIDLIEVNAESHLPSSQDWMTKQLSLEQPYQPPPEKKSANMPGRHKHQITFLAQQAKERELELKNQWSQNRFTRRQTQSKYGF